MRVVTTCHKAGLEQYGHRWLESRKNWPRGTEFKFYTEGFEVDCPGRDFSELPDFSSWKARHLFYRPPDWRFDVVRFAHKVFAIHDALYDHKGVGVWLDADVVTHKKIPKGLIEKQVEGVYVAHYGRTGLYTETGLIVFNCDHPQHKQFLNAWKEWYLSGRFRKLPQWHDCTAFDAAMKQTGVPAFNLSGEHHKSMHPMAVTELGRYVDHTKGPRKELGYSPENKFRKAA